MCDKLHSKAEVSAVVSWNVDSLCERCVDMMEPDDHILVNNL